MFIRYRMMQQSVIHHVDDNALCVSVVCKQGMCHSTLAVRVKTCKLSFFFDFFSKKILIICLRNLPRILLVEYLARVRHALT